MPQTKPAVPYADTFWVLPNQFLAGEHPTEHDEASTIATLNGRLDAGIRTFIDLTEEQEVKGYYRLLRTEAGSQRIAITFLRIPIPDQGVPSVWTLNCILDVIDRSVAATNPVFVHCFAGIGRTGTVVGCYLVSGRKRVFLGMGWPRGCCGGGWIRSGARLCRSLKRSPRLISMPETVIIRNTRRMIR